MAQLIDIAKMYKSVKSPRRPFSYFFKSRGFQLAELHLKEDLELPENQIMIRKMPSRGNPTVAKVHPIIAVEFIRWLDFGVYTQQVMKNFGYE